MSKFFETAMYVCLVSGYVLCLSAVANTAEKVMKPAPAKLVPPPPVQIDLNYRLGVLETKVDSICGMVKYIYRRQIIEDSSEGKKNIPPADIKLWGTR